MARRSGKRDAAKEASWRRWIKMQASSGLKIRAFCRQKNICERAFYRWRTAFVNREQDTLGHVEAASANNTPLFAEVKLVPPTPTAAIEIILTDARRVVIPPGFDRASLQAVLEILERPTC